MLVVARAEDGSLRSLTTRPGQDRYVLEVPFRWARAGLHLPAPTRPIRSAPRDRTRLLASKCGTGPLVGLKVASGQSIRDADIDDWYIPEALASTLSRPKQAGATPAEAPARTAPSDEWRETGTDPEMNFSAWPADAGGPAKPAPLDVAHLPAAAARWGCGTGCESWALIDGRTGRVTFPGPPFDPVQYDFPCDAEPLEYRLGRRQLRVPLELSAAVLRRSKLTHPLAAPLSPTDAASHPVRGARIAFVLPWIGPGGARWSVPIDSPRLDVKARPHSSNGSRKGRDAAKAGETPRHSRPGPGGRRASRAPSCRRVRSRQARSSPAPRSTPPPARRWPTCWSPRPRPVSRVSRRR